MNAKKWWQSRTIWFNAAAGSAAWIAGAWDQYVSKLNLSPTAAMMLGMAVAGANVGLRFITTDPIAAKKLEDQ